MINPSDIRLEMTSFACPEQYDAFLGEELVGYLRLRHGRFYVTCPYHVFDNIVYEAYPEGDGIFDPEERDQHLDAAKYHIADKLNNL